MNREIKFRCWDKSSKKMSQIHHLGSSFFAKYGISGVESYDENKYAVMQYTGLLDKNGKEIYEGDVVQVFSQLVHTTPAEESTSGREYVTLTPGTPCFKKEIKYEKGRPNFPEDEERYYEVIGNIYENPELIK